MKIFQYFNNLSPFYINNVFKPAGQKTTATRTYLFKFSKPLRKTNHAQESLSYVASCIWNKLPDFLKTSENVNTFNHKVIVIITITTMIIVFSNRYYYNCYFLSLFSLK